MSVAQSLAGDEPKHDFIRTNASPQKCLKARGGDALPMIKTKADLAKLTHRQREVLTLLARQLSNNEIVRLLHIAEATTNIDAEALLQAYATVQEGIITDDAGALKWQP